MSLLVTLQLRETRAHTVFRNHLLKKVPLDIPITPFTTIPGSWTRKMMGGKQTWYTATCMNLLPSTLDLTRLLNFHTPEKSLTGANVSHHKFVLDSITKLLDI